MTDLPRAAMAPMAFPIGCHRLHPDTRSFWMIEPDLSDGHRVAKCEQMVFVGGNARLEVDLDSGEPTWRDIPQARFGYLLHETCASLKT